MSVHSHAVAPESSGAFFLDMGTERCVFQAGGLRNALRASQAVRATDVMVNTGERDKPSSFLARARNNQRGYRFTPIAMLFSSSNIPILHPLNVDPDITKPPIAS